MERVAVYPGTFDPPTLGHSDIIGRALRLVDHLVIGVAINRDKGPLFALEERVKLVDAEIKPLLGPGRGKVTIKPFEGLLVDFATANGATMIVRGLRNVTDFDYEFQMTAMNRRMREEVETVFLLSDASTQAIASRLVKEIARMGGNARPFLSPAVANALYARLGRTDATVQV